LKSQLIVCIALILSLLASPAFGGCGKWVVRDNTDFLTDPIFDQAVASSTGSNATVNSDGTPIVKNETKEADATEGTSAAADQNEAEAIDLAGKWRINLVNGQAEQNAGKALDLILIQTGDRLQGYGTILEDGIDIPATATGTISKEGVNLDVKMTQQKKDYRLDMSLVKSELEGSYELYDKETLAENGNATASRTNT
jgi:hypothetical protein